MMTILLYILLGITAGIISGMVGIGGGVVITPALIFLFGLSQHQAQGTTLALLVPPVGLMSAWVYYQKGYVDLKIALFLCIGFLIGGLLGAKFAMQIPEFFLTKFFGGFMLLLALKMILLK
jgi:uncharacterized membrane protein YfcA